MIKLIEIDDDNRVTLTGKNIDESVDGYQAAVQRFMIAFFNTAGTMVDNPTWGAGIKQMFLSLERNRDEVKTEVAQKVDKAVESLRESRDDIEPFSIMGATLKSFDKDDTGFSAEIALSFFNASSQRIRLGQDVTKQLRQTEGT